MQAKLSCAGLYLSQCLNKWECVLRVCCLQCIICSFDVTSTQNKFDGLTEYSYPLYTSFITYSEVVCCCLRINYKSVNTRIHVGI